MPKQLPRVEFEPFANRGRLAVLQAIRISRLVSVEEWLKTEQVGTHHRYYWPLKAVDSVRRLAASETLQAYLIHSSSTAVAGLATIIRDQHVLHPHQGRIEGDDIDYWLAASQPLNIHSVVAEKLCEEQNGRPSFATVISGSFQAEARNHSFGEHMRKVGGPAKLGFEGEDHYEVARDGAVSQVYQLNP